MTSSTNLLGLDLNLIDPSDAQGRILQACAKCWFEKNDTGLNNWGDCSGFVKAVQAELNLQPFEKLHRANEIFDDVETRPDWLVLGQGSHALAHAGVAARQGSLTIGVWKNPKKGANGHVAIITTYLELLGIKPEQHALGAWGQLHSVGRMLDKMSASFGKDKHKEIRYAKCLIPII